ncbi:DUF350 domain-containing protein [Pelagicoccus sp. SDUM812002]|uniref:DUF350 domain-containing protein n=1 Tax=Pelagicoccus sp. SDUM812002 TaxID=3041266 RepID=UPI00280CE250|nr:DUF350 domain-containing protein [Pelagicoccus sp. SDUM812002]MDQ8184746.1 DUF350 domain-containing protein [Pelagicoccus sp. SDUM812002]
MDTTTLSSFFGTEDAVSLLDPSAVVFLAVSILILWIGKLVNDFCTPYQLAHELTSKDNKAIAVSFSGYMLAITVILWGVLRQDIPVEELANVDPGKQLFLRDLGGTLLWSLFGILLLQVARVINDKILLSRFSNVKELVEDQNIGTGAVQAGAYVGSAFIIQAATFGESSGSLVRDILVTLAYFFVSQLAFILFAMVYQKLSAYDLHNEIERDNAAAGVGFGITLSAVGILLSSYIVSSSSILGLALWFVICVFLLSVSRFAIDRVILPGSPLDEEISKDRNWGAALIEGAAAIGLALILTTLFHS